LYTRPSFGEFEVTIGSFGFLDMSLTVNLSGVILKNSITCRYYENMNNNFGVNVWCKCKLVSILRKLWTISFVVAIADLRLLWYVSINIIGVIEI